MHASDPRPDPDRSHPLILAAHLGLPVAPAIAPCRQTIPSKAEPPIRLAADQFAVARGAIRARLIRAMFGEPPLTPAQAAEVEARTDAYLADLGVEVRA